MGAHVSDPCAPYWNYMVSSSRARAHSQRRCAQDIPFEAQEEEEVKELLLPPSLCFIYLSFYFLSNVPMHAMFSTIPAFGKY